MTRLLLFILIAWIVPLPVFGQEETSASVTRTFRLPFHGEGIPASVFVPVSPVGMAFKKEPDFGRRQVRRGALMIGKRRDQWIWLAWDKKLGTLYLDLNRNRDLTDDPQGVVKSQTRGSSQNFMFTAPVETTGTVLAHRFQLSCYRNDIGGANVLSGWQGTVELAGRSWTVSVGDNLDGEISGGDAVILSRADNSTSRASPLSNSLQLGYARALFIDDHAYRLGFSFDHKVSPPAILMSITEEHPVLGELKIPGGGTRRIVFHGGNDGWLACVDDPGPSVLLPEGHYPVAEISVPVNGGRDLATATHRDLIRISRGQAAEFRGGGAVKQNTRLERSGRVLTLSYSLTGDDGENYTLQNPAALPSEPAFAIYRGEKEILSGRFAYG